MILLWHNLEFEPEPVQHWSDDHAAGSMQWRVNNPQRFRFASHSGIEDERFEPVHISLVDVLSDNRHFSLLLLRQRRERLGRDRGGFGHDPAGVWIDRL